MIRKAASTSRNWRVVKVDGMAARTLAITVNDIPPVAPEEVLVRIRAAALNYTDLLVYTGVNQALPQIIPCSDMAGEVISIGSGVSSLKVGDRVAANRLLAHIDGELLTSMVRQSATGSAIDGVLMEYRTFPAESLVIIPSHLSFEEGATLGCVGVTAYNCLFGEKPIAAGDTVLLLGTGAVSMFAAQYASAVGAEVIFTSSSDVKIAKLRQLGFLKAINYTRTPQWHVEVLKMTGGLGVSHIVETGGQSTLRKSIECIRTGGYIHCVGFLDTTAPDHGDLELTDNGFCKNYVVRGVFVGSVALFREMNQFISRHQLQPMIDRVFPFDNVPNAYEYFKKQVHMGKVVIQVA